MISHDPLRKGGFRVLTRSTPNQAVVIRLVGPAIAVLDHIALVETLAWIVSPLRLR